MTDRLCRYLKKDGNFQRCFAFAFNSQIPKFQNPNPRAKPRKKHNHYINNLHKKYFKSQFFPLPPPLFIYIVHRSIIITSSARPNRPGSRETNSAGYSIAAAAGGWSVMLSSGYARSRSPAPPARCSGSAG